MTLSGTLLTGALLGCLIPSYAQYNQRTKQKFLATPFTISEFLPGPKVDYASKGLINSLGDSKDDATAESVRLDRSELNREYRMPCFVPKGNFTMRIHKPDPTIRYTMLIKRF